MDSNLKAPGLYTDQQSPRDFHWMALHGYEWLSYQAVNPRLSPAVRDFDLAPARAGGFKSVGIWGVTYGNNDAADPVIFRRDGKLMGQQAIKLGADHLHVDAEQCAKGTRPGRGLQPIIDGIREGGWSGPVHLSTLGAPSNARTAANPGGNDFQIDVASFLATGGGVLPQAYVNIAPEYLPKLCVAYWLACGIPPDRLNVMIEPSTEGSAISGAGWVPLLRDAGVGRNLSIFMAQFGPGSDYDALDALTLAPAPPVVPTPNEIRAHVLTETERWLSTRPGPESLSRLRLIHRIAQGDNADPGWGTIAPQIKALLDGLGVA